MDWISTKELRKMFLSFFEGKQHYCLPSFSLIPKGDDSLLLINSGMAPMKNFFTGAITPPSTRVTTCQKCIRTQDIERVGLTARHGTFFEMLGNFSFGDYFKREAIEWSHEFLTEVLKIPEDRLWYTVYKEDEEAYDIWVNHVKVPKNHVIKMDKDSNFWEHGKGPCGPCSEIYYDCGPQRGCGKENCSVGCDCDRYIEIWNLVFTQFENDGKGNYTTLKQKNIDTGMGLERIACVIQSVDNLFMIDSVKNITNAISKISGINMGHSPKTDIALRIITDHVRSMVFMISDGILPSNEGRGYVLRRLIRRAVRYAKILQIDGDFLPQICDAAINENKDAYPELLEKQDFIKKIVSVEEINFRQTLNQGLSLLQQIIKDLKASKEKILDGEKAFKLSDTYGFPFDLTKEIALENGILVDKDKFDKLMLDQKSKAREARKQGQNSAWEETAVNLSSFGKTEFLGYDNASTESKIVSIIKNNNICNELNQGSEAYILLDKTPFYAEGGGQISDVGILRGPSIEFEVKNVTKTADGYYLHFGKLNRGLLKVSDNITAIIDTLKRENIARNHTAAHLLQAALRKVLGSHVEQAGQQVGEKGFRFDFTHFSALSKQEIQRIETLVSDEIYKSVEILTEEMPLSQAKACGAMALFGEKYGDIVRVVRSKDGFSKELCGGTHVKNTAELSIFKVISETSVAAGVRRIEAVTGREAEKYFKEKLDLLDEIASILKANNPTDIPINLRNMLKSIKEKESELQKFQSRYLDSEVGELLNSAETYKNLKIICKSFDNITLDNLKKLCDKIRDKESAVIGFFILRLDSAANILVSVGDAAIKEGIHAGKLVKTVAAYLGGNGGGKAQFAMAGLRDAKNINEAFGKAKSSIKDMILNNNN